MSAKLNIGHKGKPNMLRSTSALIPKANSGHSIPEEFAAIRMKKMVASTDSRQFSSQTAVQTFETP